MLNAASFDYLTPATTVKSINNNDLSQTKSDRDKININTSEESDISIIGKVLLIYINLYVAIFQII